MAQDNTQQADSNEESASPEKPSAEQTDAEIISEAKKRRQQCVAYDSDNRALALDDLLFLVGGKNQWDPKAVQSREDDGRPIITVNVLPTYLHQVTNDQRQNTPSIKVSPVDDNADIETARVRQGLIRHIEYDSNADAAYDTAVNSGAAIGFGYFRLLTEYTEEDSFDQDIKIKRIRNAMSVRVDPFSVEADTSDKQFCFVDTVLSRDEFKRQHPTAEANNEGLLSDEGNADWVTQDSVLITEYYRIEKEDISVCLYSNGQSGFKDALQLPMGVSIVKERKGTRSKVMWYKLTAADVLDRVEIKCKWIPVFPVYGDEIDVQGKVYRSGIVRNAKGPCTSYNTFITAATEEVASRSKAPYIGAAGAFETFEDTWEQTNVRQFAFLEYNPKAVDGTLAPPPQRQPMADIPVGMLAMANVSGENIMRTTGLFQASLGQKGTATSGRQELAQQKEGDVANYHYYDGLIRAIGFCGRCINYMIPFYYDAERTVRILGEDGTAEYATLNQPNMEGKKIGDKVPRVLNDMSVGKYDVTVKAGPSYSTLREESAEAMGEQMSRNPNLWPVIGDLYVRSQDWPNADKIADRLEKTLAPGLAEKKEGEEEEPVVMTPQGPLPASQASQMMGEMAGQLQMATEALQKADVAKQESEALKAKESLIKEQQVLNDQALAPEREKTEQLKLTADIEKAKAAIADAEARKAQAVVDLERAKCEAVLLPDRLKLEAAQAQEKLFTADVENQGVIAERETEGRDISLKIAEALAAAKPEMPKGMSIKSPVTGQTYEVTMN